MGITQRPTARHLSTSLGPLLLLLVMLAAFALLWGLPFLVSPFSSDEEYYALGGRVIFEGKNLYTDFWDIKPPLIYLVYAPLTPFAERPELTRAFHLLISMLSVGLVYLLADRFFSCRAALLAAALYGFSFFALADYTALGE